MAMAKKDSKPPFCLCLSFSKMIISLQSISLPLFLCVFMPLTIAFTPFHADSAQPSKQHDEGRRAFFLDVASAGSVLLLPLNPAPAQAFIINPQPQSITTVVLDSPSSRAGIQLTDVRVSAKMYSAVKSAEPDGEASKNGVQVGMLILGKHSSKDVVNQIKNGPYPIVLQFYNLAEETGAASAAEGLHLAQTSEAPSSTTAYKEPKLSYAGAGLGTKVIRKGEDCKLKVRRGDTVKVSFEARVASPGGPIYDSTQERGGPITFTLGEGKAINGVEIGMGGMCIGEIRDLDIPSGLGYGRFGSQIFDIPGDTRLWWRIELLELTPTDMKFR
jgi:FKBP-type peptidyl-prolyl cis-trans isomerase